MAAIAGLAQFLGHRPPRHRQPGLRLLEGPVRQYRRALCRRRPLRCEQAGRVFPRLAGIPFGLGRGDAGGFPGLKQPASRHRLLGHLAILTTALLWGSLIPLLDILLAYFDVYALSAIRYGAAGILLLGGLVAIGGGGWLRRLPLGKVLLLGIGGICGFGTFYTLAIATTAPGMAIVIASATPAISAVFAAVFYRIPFEKGAGIAFLLPAIGAVPASLGRDGAIFTFDLRGGEVLFVVAAICWAWYS